MDRIVLEREGLSFPRETTFEHSFASYNQVLSDARAIQATEGFEFAKSFFKAAYRYLSNAIFAPIVQGFAVKESFEALSRLNDRELADIGISRSDIPRYALGLTTTGSYHVDPISLNGWSPDAAKVSNDADQNIAA